jgi:hypothetical protein
MLEIHKHLDKNKIIRNDNKKAVKKQYPDAVKKRTAASIAEESGTGDFVASAAMLARNLLIYGLDGVLMPFPGHLYYPDVLKLNILPDGPNK